MAAPETEKQHISAETLVDYFDQRLSDRQESEIERHIACCDECTALARRVRRLCGVWDHWTAATHATALKAKGAEGNSFLSHAAKTSPGKNKDGKS